MIPMTTAVRRSACNDEVEERAVVVMDSVASADKLKPSLPHTGVGLVLGGDATYDDLEVSAVRMQGVEHGS